MKKQFWGLLLVLSLVVILFPTNANAATTYNIWVGGTQVTSANATNILGNNTASYESSSKTLTLNNANINSWYSEQDEEYASYAYGIYSKDALNIILQGNNTVDISSASGNPYTYAVKSEISINIGGSGSLTATAPSANTFSSGICSEGTVTINSGTINANSGGVGIYGSSTTINGGTIEITGRQDAFNTDPILSGYTANKSIMVGNASPGTAWNNSTPLNTYEFVKIEPYTAPTTFAVTIAVNKDNAALAGHGKTFKLMKSGTDYTDLSIIPNGTYDVYEGATDTLVNVTVSGASTSVTVDYYTLSVSAGTGTSSVSSVPSSGIYLMGSSVTISATPSIGYVWEKWSDNDTTQSRTIIVNAKTNLIAYGKLKEATAPVLTGDNPSLLTYGYTNAPSMTVGITGKDANNFNYTYAWYEGSNSLGTAIAGASTDAYTAPTGLTAGSHNYTAKIAATNKADGSKTASADKTFTVTVNKASGSGSVIMAGWTYGGGASNPVPTSTTNGTGAVSYTYAGRNGTTYANSQTKPTNAGDYTVTATFLASGNYVQCTATAEFTIDKAPVTFVVTNNNLEYNASARSATVTQTDSETLKINVNGYTVSYEQAGLAVASPTSKGSYDAIVTISDPNFKHASTAEAASKVGTLTINGTTYSQAANMAWPTAANLTYGQKLSESTLTGGDQTASGSYAWKDGTSVPTVSNSAYTVVFTPNDINYSPVEQTIPTTVAKATPVLSLPMAANITYGQKLSASVFTGGSASTTYNGNSGTNVPGAFTWAEPGTMPAISDSSATEYALTFTPTDSGNYNIVTTGKVMLMVEPKEVGFTWNGHEGLVYSGNPVNVTATASGLVGSDTCTVTVTGGNKTDAGNHNATAMSLINPNYKLPVSKTQSYTIDKAPVTFIVTNNNLEYNASARSATVTQTDSETLKINVNGYTVSYEQAGLAVASPTSKGSYDVVVTISDPNFKHASTAEASSKVGTFTINGTMYSQAANMTWPTAANLTYGQKLSESTLTGGDQTASGSYAWKDGTSVPTVSNSAYTVVFTPNDTNYSPVEQTIPTTVAKAAPVLSLPMAANITYGQKLSASAFTGGSASTTYNGNSGTNVPGAFTWAEPGTMPTVSDSSATEYALTFTPTDSGNYNIVTTGKVMLMVEPKEVGFTWNGHEGLVYSGNPVNVTATASGLVGSDTCTVTVTGGNKTDAGNHNATAMLLSNPNYKLPVSKTQSYTIAKAPIAFVVSGNRYIYDANIKTATVIQTAGQTPAIAADKFSVSYQKSGDVSGTADKTDASDYDVMVTINDNNFKHKDTNENAWKVGTLTIGKKPITALWKNLHNGYDGEVKLASFALTGVESVDSSNVSAQISGGEQKNVGFHSVTADLTGSRAGNYKLTNPMGTLVIQKAPVTFTVSGDMVKHDGSAKTATVIATANNVQFNDFTVTYQKDNKAMETPSDIGSYDIYAQVANTNYRHVDGSDGIARKIGVLNIYKDTAPATYTLSFAPGEGGSGSITSMASTQAGTSRVLQVCTFTKSDYAFGGWQYNGKTYQTGEVMEQPSSNITLTALWMKSTYTINGAVDQDGNPAAEAVVTLMLGSQQIAETVTDVTGKYIFANVAPGLYNLVASKNGVTQTVKVEITSSNVDNKNVILPKGKANSVVIVASGTPAIVVGNLEQTFSKTDSTVYTEEDKVVVGNGGSVEIKLTAKLQTEDTNNADQSQIAKQAIGTVALYLDLSLEKTVTSELGVANTTKVPVSNVLLESVIQLPGELQGKSNYMVYRVHDAALDTLTTSPNKDGEYIKVNSNKTALTVYSKNFSTYAIAYTKNSGGSGSGGGGGLGVIGYPISINSTGISQGSIKADKESAAADTKVNITVRPNEGYKLSKLTITDKDGKAIAYRDNGDGTYSFTMPSSKINVTPVFEKTDSTFPFVDVTEGHWARKAIEWAYEKHLFAGTSKTTFAPNASTTRGMIVTVLYRMEGSPTGYEKTIFSDVAADSYCANSVGWGFKQGIIQGYNSKKYGSEDKITREQLAAILYRYAGFKNYDLNKSISLDRFTDGKQTSDYAEKAMSWVVGNDLICGKGHGILDPTGKATRAEVATILMRFDTIFGK